jgi:photosystem II stability/assembly factor-like uncharacterized protein
MIRQLNKILIVCSVLMVYQGYSQVDLSKFINENGKESEEFNFYDYREAIDKYLESQRGTEIKGMKQYRRWEWFWDARLYPEGRFPDTYHNYFELNKLNSRLKGSSSRTADWTSFSPAEIPQSTSEFNINGMGRINCIEFHPADTNTYWIGAASGGVWKTMDDGKNWMCITDGLPINRISCITVDKESPDTIYIGTGDIEYHYLNSVSNGSNSQYGIGIYKTTNGGTNWFPTGLNFDLWDESSSLIRKIFINPQNSMELVAAGIGGIFRSEDAGDSWSQIHDQAIIDLDLSTDSSSILFATGMFIYLSNSTNLILRSEDFGLSWDTLATNLPATSDVSRTELAIAASNDSIIYTISSGSNGGFYCLLKSIDRGNTWSTVCARDTSLFIGAVKAPNVLGWQDGGYFNNPLLPEDNGGQGYYDLTLVVDPNDPDQIYTGGINMWGSSDGGLNWNLFSYWQSHFGESIHADQHASAFHPLSSDFFQANDGGLFKTKALIPGNLDTILNCINVFTLELEPNCYEFPGSWTDLSHGLHITEYYRLGVSKSESNHVSAGCQDNGTYLFKDGSWTNIYGGDGMETMIHPDNPEIIYITTQWGKLYRTVDGGLTFSDNLAEPIEAAGEWSAWVTPYLMDTDDPNTLYTGHMNIWKSTDAGETWTQLSYFSSDDAVTALTVAENNSNVIYFSRNGHLKRSLNGGQNWTDISQGLPIDSAVILSIAIADTLESNLWVAFSAYKEGSKVFKSTDYGDSWENVSGSLPNVSANTLVYQKGTIGGITNALYVGTDLGVFYTNDSIMETTDRWVSHSQGLPVVPVNELEIHYGSQKIYSATYGRGLWKGNLYSPSQVEGIKPVEEYEFNIAIYPNPVTDLVSIDLYLQGTQQANFEVYDTCGKLVFFESIDVNRHVLHKLSLGSLKQGTYMLKVALEETDVTKRILKL